MLPFAQSQDGWTIAFLLALALTVAVLLMRSHRYLARRRREDAGTPPPGGTLKGGPAHGARHTAAPPEVANWEVHMHETARDLMGQLDSKMRALQALTAEADRAAARLEAALDRSDEPQLADQPAESRREEIYTLSDYGYDAVEIARRLGSPVGEVELILGLRKKH